MSQDSNATTDETETSLPRDERRCQVIAAILDVKADSVRHLEEIVSPERGKSVKERLEEQTLNGVGIIRATHPRIPKPADICRVPHFGHNISCNQPCQGPGVFRLYEVAAVVEPVEATQILDRYRLGEEIEIDVCGIRDNIQPISEFAEFTNDNVPPVGRFGRDYDDGTDDASEGELDGQRDRLGIVAPVERNSTLSEFATSQN